MSRVFVGEERALGRKVVVKVLLPDTGAAVSVERFKREIQVAARLQHPHIVPLLWAGETDGLPFYVMPFVKGQSLRSRLANTGELSVNDAVHILRDVASALAHAHAEGVVHRDIKPDNVILSGGVAVVTDFGVAKAVDVAARTEESQPRSGMTSIGVALGTPAYMSPEQASADPHVDHRADIYAFGVMAYEMLAGTSPFANRSPQQMLAAHVSETPESLSKRRPSAPLTLATLVMKCLEKRAADRPQSASEIIQALDAITTPTGGTIPTGVPLRAVRTRRLTVALVTGFAAAVAIAIISYFLFRSPAFYVAGTATQIASAPELEVDASISPDGRFVAYAAGPIGQMRIFVRQIGGGRAVPLSGDLGGDHRWPRWSRDGTRISFATDDAVYLVPALGGAARRLFAVEVSAPATPALSPDGKSIAYSTSTGIWLRPVDGGEPHQVVKGERLHSAAWAPDGNRLAYVQENSDYVTSRDLGNIASSAVWSIASSGGAPIRITDAVHLNTSPAWIPDGRSLLYVSNAGGTRDVYQQPVGSGGGPAGPAARLTTGLNAFTITVSAAGTRLAYSVLLLRSNVWQATLRASGTTPASDARPVTTGNQAIEGVAVSLEGKWLAYDTNINGNQDIYKLSLDGKRNEPIQVTRDSANEFQPVWSPDDREIAFHGTRTGSSDIFVVNAEGGELHQITHWPRREGNPGWSPDGNSLCFTSNATGLFELYVVTRSRTGGWTAPRQVSSEPHTRAGACGWSSDGRHIVRNTQGGPPRIINVADGSSHPMPGLSSLSGEITLVVWGPGPETLFFAARSPNGEHAIWSVRMSGGAPRLVLRLDSPAWSIRRRDFATDGQSVFFVASTDEADVWVMDLRAR